MAKMKDPKTVEEITLAIAETERDLKALDVTTGDLDEVCQRQVQIEARLTALRRRLDLAQIREAEERARATETRITGLRRERVALGEKINTAVAEAVALLKTWWVAPVGANAKPESWWAGYAEWFKSVAELRHQDTALRRSIDDHENQIRAWRGQRDTARTRWRLTTGPVRAVTVATYSGAALLPILRKRGLSAVIDNSGELFVLVPTGDEAPVHWIGEPAATVEDVAPAKVPDVLRRELDARKDATMPTELE